MIATLKNWIVNALLMLGGILLPLIALEFYLEWDDKRPDSRPFVTDVTLNGTAYKFLATPDAINDPSDAVLIAGDSFTAGYACADDRTFPSAFTKAATRSGSSLHAVNMGVVGTGPMAFVARAQDYWAEKGSSAGLIVSLYANDVELDCFACRRQEWASESNLTPDARQQLGGLCESCLKQSERPSGETAGSVGVVRRFNWWLIDHSLGYRVLREGLAKIAVATGALPTDWGRGSYPQRWSNLEGIHYKFVEGSIALAKKETDRRGIPLLVVIYPDSMLISKNNEFYAIYEKVSAALRQNTGAAVYSGYEAFLGHPRTKASMPFSMVDSHPDCQAHEIFGDWVFQKWSTLQ